MQHLKSDGAVSWLVPQEETVARGLQVSMLRSKLTRYTTWKRFCQKYLSPRMIRNYYCLLIRMGGVITERLRARVRLEDWQSMSSLLDIFGVRLLLKAFAGNPSLCIDEKV
mmetsp:Transcript_21115/g.42269  ORF Transcript_21115/g.42269 Transcript_21115/m.42269 type:complete len:111 (+) Transcript_21115:1169-1501(+)